jgi:hypothetical protein
MAAARSDPAADDDGVGRDIARVVRMPVTRPSLTSTPVTSVPGETVSAPSSMALSRMSVPP